MIPQKPNAAERHDDATREGRAQEVDSGQSDKELERQSVESSKHGHVSAGRQEAPRGQPHADRYHSETAYHPETKKS